MTLRPGESTTITLEFLMHGNMGGQHDFRVQFTTNEPGDKGQHELTVLSNWVE